MPSKLSNSLCVCTQWKSTHTHISKEVKAKEEESEVMLKDERKVFCYNTQSTIKMKRKWWWCVMFARLMHAVSLFLFLVAFICQILYLNCIWRRKNCSLSYYLIGRVSEKKRAIVFLYKWHFKNWNFLPALWLHITFHNFWLSSRKNLHRREKWFFLQKKTSKDESMNELFFIFSSFHIVYSVSEYFTIFLFLSKRWFIWLWTLLLFYLIHFPQIRFLKKIYIFLCLLFWLLEIKNWFSHFCLSFRLDYFLLCACFSLGSLKI